MLARMDAVAVSNLTTADGSGEKATALSGKADNRRDIVETKECSNGTTNENQGRWEGSKKTSGNTAKPKVQTLSSPLSTEGNDCKVAMGVSLPRYENGGQTYKRPRSLLWDAPDEPTATGRLRSESDDEEEYRITALKKKKRNCGVCPPSHFAGMPIPAKVLGVCAECGMVEEEWLNATKYENEGNGNVIILCDGPGCDREFHLKCCRPPLLQVPEEDEYFCFDCHPNGGHAATLLDDYLDEIERERESHNAECEEYRTFVDASYVDPDTLSSNGSQSFASPNKSPLKATTPVATRRRQRRTSNSRRNNDVDDETPTKPSSDHYGRKTLGSKHKSRNKQYTFVDQLIYNDMKEHQSELISQLENGICSEAVGKGPPCSELDIFHRSKSKSRRHRASAYVGVGRRNLSNKQTNGKADNNDDDESLLVGCAIRLYCAKTKSYHTGRILDVRHKTTDYTDDSVSPSCSYNGFHDTECLVRFPAGRDYRKKTITRWIYLEEHSLAVACPDLVWGKFPIQKATASPKRKKSPTSSQAGKHRWMPTKLWLRSSRELVMSMRLLEESLGQISYRAFRNFLPGTPNLEEKAMTPGASMLITSQEDGNCRSASGTLINAAYTSLPYLQQEWILAECIGRGIYNLLNVPTETKCHNGDPLFVSPTDPNCNKSSRKVGKKSAKNVDSKANESGDDFRSTPREDQIMSALVRAECEERTRVRRWNKLRLNNLWHKRALTSLDESALGPLVYDDNSNENHAMLDTCDVANVGNGEVNAVTVEKRPLHIQPTPLIRTGLDRMYIMEQFITQLNRYQRDEETDNRPMTGTKDLAINMSCDLVSNDSITAIIRQENRLSQLRQQGEREESVKGGPGDLSAELSSADATFESGVGAVDGWSVDISTKEVGMSSHFVHSKTQCAGDATIDVVLKSPTSSTGIA